MAEPELNALDARPAGCLEPTAGERVLAHLDLLVAESTDLPGDVVAHAAACPACAAEVDEAKAALGELPDTTVKAIVTGAPVAPTLTVLVSCVYCHDRLSRVESVYCASCLAPHHAGCFEQHGRCAVRGCEDRRFVRPVEAQPPARRRRGWPWALSLVAVSVGAAALVAERRGMVLEDPPSLQVHEVVDDVAPVEADPVVARVDGTPIRRSELDHACALVRDFYLLPEGLERQRARLEALDRLIDERAVLNASGGYAASEEDRRRAKRALEREGISMDGQSGLAGPRVPLLFQAWGEGATHITRDGLHERVLAREVAESIVRLKVPRDQDVPLADVHRYYQEHLSEFWSGGEVRFRELVLYPDRRDAAREVPLEGEWSLDEALARVELRLQAYGFVNAAERWSMDALGGAEQLLVASELDRVLVPPLPAVLTGLKPGEVSPPVRLYTGSVHRFELIARTDPVTRPLREVEDEIRAKLRDERWAERRRAWVRARRAAARVWLGDLEPSGGAR